MYKDVFLLRESCSEIGQQFVLDCPRIKGLKVLYWFEWSRYILYSSDS